MGTTQETGIKDINGRMVHNGDYVYFPHIDEPSDLKIVSFKEEEWVADKPDGTPDSWLDSTCLVVDIDE